MSTSKLSDSNIAAMSTSRLSDTDFSMAVMSTSKLSDTDFSMAVMSTSKLSDTDSNMAVMSTSKLSNADSNAATMLTFNSLVQKLSSANSDVETKIAVAVQLSDNLQHYEYSPIYAECLKSLVPVLILCLESPPVFISTSAEQKLRACVLKIIYQLPKNPPEPFEPYEKDVVDLLIGLVKMDNEENGLLCIKTITDIIRHQTKDLGDVFQPVFALIYRMFSHIELVVREQLDNQASHNSIPGKSLPGSFQAHENPHQLGNPSFGQQQQIPTLLKAMSSFNVLSECPVIVESIAQKSSVSMDIIKNIFFCIRSVLLLQAKPQEQAHATAAANGTVFIGVSVNISNRAVFEGFIKTQVKALSFLVYLLQIPKEQYTKVSELTEFKNFLRTLPDIMIRLLKDCPCERSDLRYELLIAVRRIMLFHKEPSAKNFDQLLDERVLIGERLTAYETQRPLAYSLISDIIELRQPDLKPPQIRKIVETYIKNLLDNSLLTPLQNTSAQILMDMIEYIAKIPDKFEARYCLIMILNAIGNKFATMNQQHSNAVKLSKLYVQQSTDTSPDTYLAEDKILFKIIIENLQNIFDLLKKLYIGFTTEEAQVIHKLCHEGASFFQYYEVEEIYLLEKIFLTPFQKYKQIHRKRLNAHAKEWVYLFIWSVLFRIRDGLSRPSQKFSFAAKFHLSKEHFVKIIDDDELYLEKEILRFQDNPPAGLSKKITQNHKFRATIYNHWFPRAICSLIPGKISQQNFGRFLVQILENSESGPLRKVVVENIEVLIESSGHNVEGDTRYTAMINSISIMHSLCKFEGDKEWMGKKVIIIWLKNMEKHLRANTLPLHLRLAVEQARAELMVIFTKSLECQSADLDNLFSLIEFIANGSHQNHLLFTHIHRIIWNKSIESQSLIVERSIELYASNRTSQKTRISLIRNIVSPMVAMDVKRPSGPLLLKAVIKSVHTKIWKANPNDVPTQPGTDHAIMEMLQLTAFLIEHHHSILYDVRQDIINFGLAYAYFEDTIIKYTANIVIGYCIAHFETPAEIVQRVYTSLLESSYYEVPALLMRALDLISPVLPKLCNAELNDQDPIWVVIPHRILIKERQNVQQMTTVFYFLVKNAEFFYKYRDKFIIPIVKSLRTIAPPLESFINSKELVLQLMTLVCKWERRCAEEKKNRKFEDRGGQLMASSTLAISEYNIPALACSEMIDYLAEVISLRTYPLVELTPFNNLLEEIEAWEQTLNLRQFDRRKR